MTPAPNLSEFAIAVFHNAGDILCCTPVAHQLKADHPDSRITWFTADRYTSVLDGNPYIDEVVALSGDPNELDQEIPSLKRLRPWTAFYTPAPYMNYAARPGAPLFDLIRAHAAIRWTVPFVPVLRLSQQERSQAKEYMDALPHGPKILVETEFKSQQSPWENDYAFDMLRILKPLDPVFIFSSLSRPAFFDRFVIQHPKTVWCMLPLRIHAEIFNLCHALIGVSSGISAVCLSDICRTDIPKIEVSRGEHWSAAAYPHLDELTVCFSRARFQNALRNLVSTLTNDQSSPDFSRPFHVVAKVRGGAVQVGCPGCGVTTGVAVRGEDIVQCEGCSLVYLRRRPAESVQESTCGKGTVTGNRPDQPARLPPSLQEIDSIPEFMAAQRSSLLDEAALACGGSLSGRTLIDIGCGWGALLLNARRRGMFVHGFADDPSQAEFGRTVLGLDIHLEPLLTIQVPENSADVVVMSHSLDHVPNPFETLEKIQFVLKAGGIFLCLTPNFDSLSSQVLKDQWPWLDCSRHFAFFTPHSLREMLLQTGFRILHNETRSGDFGIDGPLAVLKSLNPAAAFPDSMALLKMMEDRGFGEEILLVACKRGRTKCRRLHKLDQPRRILWVRTDAIGDNVLASSMLPLIREAYPQARISVLCQVHVQPIYEGSPCVDEIISFQKDRAYSDACYLRTLASRLADAKFDLALNSVFSREPITDFLTLASKAPTCIAFEGDLCNINEGAYRQANTSYTRLIPGKTCATSELERHRHYLKSLGISSPPLQPVLWLTEEDDAFAESFFRDRGLDPERTVGLFVGAQHSIRIYPFYGEAMADLVAEHGLQVIAFGSEKEVRLNADVLRRFRMSSHHNLCGQTNLRQTAALLKRCRIGIGAETGTAHIAAAVGTPHVVVIGGGHFGRFMPYSPLSHLVCLPLGCYGCNWKCPYPHAHCIRDLAPSVLEQAVRFVIERREPGPHVFVQNRLSQNRDNPPDWGWPVEGFEASGTKVYFLDGETLKKTMRPTISTSKQAHRTPAKLKLDETPPAVGAEIFRLKADLEAMLSKAGDLELAKIYQGAFGKLFRAAMQAQHEIFPKAFGFPAAGVGEPLPVSSTTPDPLVELRDLMVRMLRGPAHRLTPKVCILDLPEWFREDYLRYALKAPEFFSESGEIDAAFDALNSTTDQLLRAITQEPNSARFCALARVYAEQVNLIWSYFVRRDMTRLLGKRATILERHLENNGCRLKHTTAKPHHGKIRLGLYLRQFYPGTETFASLPLFEELDRDRFEVFLYAHQRDGNSVETHARRCSDTFKLLPETIQQTADAVRADNLDILFFGNNLTAVTGTGPAMASHRLARHQCIHFCNPVTTGMKNMDHYLTGTLMRNYFDVSSRFTESVLSVEGSGICFSLQDTNSSLVAASLTRRDFGISGDQTIFISGANFFKVTPELRQLWATILRLIPKSFLILYPFGPSWDSVYPKAAFANELSRTFGQSGIGGDRFAILDTFKNRGEVLSVNRLADIYLDAVPYSGATSLLDPLQAGTMPLVGVGPELRFCQAAAILTEIGMHELITRNEDDYIQTAVRLAADTGLRETLRRRMLDRMSATPDFLNSRLYAKRVAGALLSLCSEFNRESLIRDREPIRAIHRDTSVI
jgi:predicted O-linked N-acetylglucosamine transferase (SPINDLY family)/ADP-heptose:LPS heptosyltransferase/2-polyprenyl-3-methyl-5-hydroxy-6-metoxy-1,4-benzoquinol methylase